MDKRVIHIFTMPQETPCGPESSCCGPIGQTEEEVQALTQGIEEKLALPVRVFNVRDGADMKDNRKILSVLRSFGWGVLPIITVDAEVVSMGPATPDQAVEAIKTQLRAA